MRLAQLRRTEHLLPTLDTFIFTIFDSMFLTNTLVIGLALPVWVKLSQHLLDVITFCLARSWR